MGNKKRKLTLLKNNMRQFLAVAAIAAIAAAQAGE